VGDRLPSAPPPLAVLETISDQGNEVGGELPTQLLDLCDHMRVDGDAPPNDTVTGSLGKASGVSVRIQARSG